MNLTETPKEYHTWLLQAFDTFRKEYDVKTTKIRQSALAGDMINREKRFDILSKLIAKRHYWIMQFHNEMKKI